MPLPLTLKLLDNKPQRNWNFPWNLMSEGKEIALESTRAGASLLERGHTVLTILQERLEPRQWQVEPQLIRAALCILCPLFKPKPHVWTLKMDLVGLSLDLFVPLLSASALNTSFPLLFTITWLLVLPLHTRDFVTLAVHPMLLVLDSQISLG